MQETQVWFLGQEDPLEKKMATHSNILAWRIPWTKEPGRLQTVGSQESDMAEGLSTAHISDIWYLSFLWLISLSMTISGCIHIAAKGSDYFFMINIPLYIYAPHLPYSLVCRWIFTLLPCLAIVNVLQRTLGCMYLFKLWFSSHLIMVYEPFNVLLDFGLVVSCWGFLCPCLSAILANNFLFVVTLIFVTGCFSLQ